MDNDILKRHNREAGCQQYFSYNPYTKDTHVEIR